MYVIRVLKIGVAYVSLFFVVIGFTALAYYWGYVAIYGSTPPEVTVNHSWDDAFMGVFFIACGARVWYVWRKG